MNTRLRRCLIVLVSLLLIVVTQHPTVAVAKYHCNYTRLTNLDLPLTYTPPGDGSAIPRHSWEILADAPGVVLIPDTETQITDFSSLSPGDLVFFHAKEENHDPQIDHVGMYLGQDTSGHYRFISSRQTIDGPTFGDVAGVSLLDGKGLYAKSFRAARRL